MNTLDWVIVVLVLVFALRGLRSGLVAGALSLVGLGAGAYLGFRLSPVIVGWEPDLAALGPLVPLITVLLLAGLGQSLARSLGTRIVALVRGVPLVGRAAGALDGLGGAALGATLGLALVWISGVLALQVPLPIQAQEQVERSGILQTVNDRVPSGVLLGAIANFDALPEIDIPSLPDDLPPLPADADPPAQAEADAEADAETSAAVSAGAEAAAPGVVRVIGVGRSEAGFGFGSSGSGWVAAPGIVVTNAHVVADNGFTAVQPGGEGRRFEAEVVAVDVRNDVAVLEAPGLEAPALPVADPVASEPAAVLGYPEGGPFDAEAGSVGSTAPVVTTDAYGDGPVQRTVTGVQAEVRPGNSGGPVVNADGEVVATIFGAKTGDGDVGYAIPSSVVQEQLAAVLDDAA